MPYKPNKYGDFGKNANDLLDDDFNFGNKLTIKRKTASGLKVDTAISVKNGGLAGKVKTVLKDKEIGEVELTADTSASFNFKAKLTQLGEGIKATIKGSVKDKDFSGGVTADYSQESFAGTVNVGLKDAKEVLSGSVGAAAVIGFDGVSLGAQAKSKVDNKFAFSSPDVNMAFQIAEDDFTFGLSTETLAQGEVGLRAKFHQTINSSTERALLFQSSENVLTFATKYALDDVTTMKHSVSTTGVLQTAITHKLANPAAKINLATQFKTTNGFDLTATKYGLGITLGDF